MCFLRSYAHDAYIGLRGGHEYIVSITFSNLRDWLYEGTKAVASGDRRRDPMFYTGKYEQDSAATGFGTSNNNKLAYLNQTTGPKPVKITS